MKNFAHLEPLDYFRIPWQRRWYALAAILVVMTAVSAVAYFRPNVYRSETRILVESATLLDEPQSAGYRDRTEERALAIRQLLESRSILEKIVQEFQLRSADNSILLEDALRSIRSNLEVSKTIGGTFTIAYYATDPSLAREITRRLADVLIGENKKAQKEKAENKDQFLQRELLDAEKALDAIDQDIIQYKKKHSGELPEQSMANMNAITSLHSQLAALDNSLDRARDQQKTLEFRLQEQKRLREIAQSIAPKDVPPTTTPEVKKDVPSAAEVQLATKRAQLAEMTARYTPRHPDVIRLSQEVQDLERQISLSKTSQVVPSATADLTPLGETSDKNQTKAQQSAQETAKVDSGSEAEIAQVKYELEILSQTIARREKDRDDIVQRINKLQDRLNGAPTIEQELLTKMRDLESKRQQVANLQTRKFNAQMAANAVVDAKFETYSVLDPASTPERAVFPTKLQIVFMGIGASLIAGIAAGFVREFFEPSLATEEEAMVVLKLPVLISVPEIPSKSLLP